MSRISLSAALMIAWLAAGPYAGGQDGVTRYSGDPAKAQVLAAKFSVDAQRVLGMRRQLKMEWPEIEQALIIACAVTNSAEKSIAMDAALNRVLELRAMGQEWRDIAQQFGATLPASAASSEPAPGTRASKIRKAAQAKASPDAKSR